jgi:hypothetical protein
MFLTNGRLTMEKILRVFLFAGTALSAAVDGGIAKADTIAASLFSPLAPVGAAITAIDLSRVTPSSSQSLTGPGFSVGFSSGFSLDQGIVQGADSAHAVPVAGVSGGIPEYLTGGYGSALTPDISASGNYLSTGLGTIEITFTNPQTSLALLWGSIDTGNSLILNDVANFSVTGKAVQAAAAGSLSNGSQGPGGSAYVVIDTDTPFTTVTATSSVVSFEFTGVAASGAPFITTTPEPSTLALLGVGLGLGVLVICSQRRTA